MASQARIALGELDPDSQRMVQLALGQNMVLEQIATGSPLVETLDTLLRFLERDSPEVSCSVNLVDADGLHLHPAAAPSLPPAYSKELDGAAIGPCAGSFGTAAYRRQPVIVSDIDTDPLWEDFRELARPHGLRACWSTPIQSAKGDLYGTFDMYFRQTATPEPVHQRLIQIALHVATIAIGKDRREKELAQLSNDLAERIKELTVQRLVTQELLVDRPVGQELFDSIVGILPMGWRYPELCRARIAYGPWVAMSDGYADAPYELVQTFRTTRGEGKISIVYLSEATSRTKVRLSADPFLAEERQLLASLAQKITIYLNRAHTEEVLAESEERYRLLNLATNDAVWDWDLRTNQVWWNDRVACLFGYEKEEVDTDLSWWTERLHEGDRERVSASLRRAADSTQTTWLEEYRFRRKDGSFAHIQDRGYVMRGAVGQATRMIGLMEDITQRKLAEAKIRELAYREPVTHLPNRAALLQRMDEAIALAEQRGHELALLLVNLNCFRDVNDCLGHQNGDAFLKLVAQRLGATIGVRGEVASLGGDEFGILLPRIEGQAEVEATLQALHESLQDSIQLRDIPIQVDATLGVALYPAHAKTGDVLWQHADIALRTAQESFEKHLFFSPKLAQYDPTRLALLAELRAAIEEGQLVLHYQPKIDLRSGATVGAEALVRWQHPTRGLIYPDTFIPLAERSGLINPLTTDVVTAALHQGTAFMQEGLAIDMAVNLSARNLHEANFSRRLLDIVKESGFPVPRLTLEITETAIMADPVRGKAVLTELHQAGIQLAMDDFGTGQSSLAYLKELPISKVKIDKSFVMDFDHPRNLAVVRSAIDLARNMGLEATAEGVETESAYVTLRDFGCELGQGYFFSRPLPALPLKRWLSESPWGIEGEVDSHENRPRA